MTFEEWLGLNTPRDRAYSVLDLRTGWAAAVEHSEVDTTHVSAGQTNDDFEFWDVSCSRWVSLGGATRAVAEVLAAGGVCVRTTHGVLLPNTGRKNTR